MQQQTRVLLAARRLRPLLTTTAQFNQGRTTRPSISSARATRPREAVKPVYTPVKSLQKTAAAEILEVVDENNRVIGMRLRRDCHSMGLCHRAVYCLVLNSMGQLLIQQRSSMKKLGANLWDVSLAEHLLPGESYCDAAVRGLREELGVCVEASCLSKPLTEPHLRTLKVAGQPRDMEYVQGFRLDGWAGSVVVDPIEVQAVKWVALPDLFAQLAENPLAYTVWMRKEFELLERVLLKGGEVQGVPPPRVEYLM